MIVRAYRPEDKQAWDELVRRSKNASVLVYRNFMEYHGQRFVDASLVAYSDDASELLAIVPAHRVGQRVLSHQGLTFAGVVVDATLTFERYVGVWKAILAYMLENTLTHLIYTAAPTIYHQVPAEEDRFILHALGATCTESKLLSAMELKNDTTQWQMRRKRALHRAQNAGLSVEYSRTVAEFYELLSAELQETSVKKPVHSLMELEQLCENFPEEIVIAQVRAADGELVGGMVVFASHQVLTTQYIAATARGKKIGALDLLIASLQSRFSSTYRYLNFGASRDPARAAIKKGILEFKEGFGARAVCIPTYELKVTAQLVTALEKVLD